MSTPEEERIVWHTASEGDQEVGLWGDLERKAQMQQLWRQSPRLLGPLQDEPADIELGDIPWGVAFLRLAGDPEAAAKLAHIREDSEARCERWQEAYRTLEKPVSGAAPRDHEQRQAMTSQQPHQGPRR
ncbi:hypothetical protein OG458_41925 (plasmid) [Streptomyces sp. NBC_01281]|uniref:hypothetical protein n=1 Tax=Streptomyces sp. NBC_01281 TaxID=2903811 RepID=UPI002E0E1ABA|nr:hypothetical protein OG458_41925 [Streptomyces sp. NBC_01281]